MLREWEFQTELLKELNLCRQSEKEMNQVWGETRQHITDQESKLKNKWILIAACKKKKRINFKIRKESEKNKLHYEDQLLIQKDVQISE